MLFDQLDRLRRGDVLVLHRGFPASWLVQALSQRGIDFVIRCDSTQGWRAARSFLRSGQAECWDHLSPCDAGQARRGASALPHGGAYSGERDRRFRCIVTGRAA